MPRAVVDGPGLGPAPKKSGPLDVHARLGPARTATTQPTASNNGFAATAAQYG
ncbi:hypothetical protein ACH4ZU_01395 [Streptomyces sp. NPDC020472]|uniref:hypothetical protein n=1 Tax=Streptomyces sp. NPDC020472 TaxID=3365075 RepID=UPI0037B79129